MHCSVIGCGRKADFVNIPNPFDPTETVNLCERCLKAGKEAVNEGLEELDSWIYEKYYKCVV